jgi:hypothetical protein
MGWITVGSMVDAVFWQKLCAIGRMEKLSWG